MTCEKIQHINRNIEVDEIKAYLDCRYISASEVCWRIFKFVINYKDPSVERLNFHHPNEQTIVFADTANLENVLRKSKVDRTMFTKWMKANEQHEEARELTYVEFPTKWVWHKHVLE